MHATCDKQFTIYIGEWSPTLYLTIKPLIPLIRLSFTLNYSTSYRYKKTVPQLLIRWSIQKDYITIPKSTKPERIQENADIFDFTISDEDMKTLVRCIKLKTL